MFVLIVTLFGIAINVSDVHPLKAPFAISVTVESTITLSTSLGTSPKLGLPL
jgi:hypothetical protein